jgi:hypothetical protein
VPVATKGKVVPSANAAFAGVTVTETRIAWPTFNVPFAVIDPALAVIVDAPTPTPLARPSPPMLATVDDDELQPTALVKSCALPSLYVPVAVNCWLLPFAIDALPGLTVNANSR